MNGATVLYGSASELRATLNYDLSEEKRFSYKGLSLDETIEHLADFVSRLWQIHVFGEGNTRTVSVFFIKYLRTLGFDVTNDVFAGNAWYFRNALVRANFNDLKNGIYETTEFLELFLRNLLLNENHPLRNRVMHINAGFADLKKANIGAEKADIERGKANIGEDFSAKTASHVRELQEALGTKSAFGRTDVQEVLGLGRTRSSEILLEMKERGLIEPVSGRGKGKYQFRRRQG
ncbi:Fic family protein [Corynebacterium phocae]|uniref:Fic family protein n=1 Tax=Corynebacterium phocae TaxID=161895 RepID=UPI000AE1BEB8|nr:Fic family protein [Corynebacterium phocae]